MIDYMNKFNYDTVFSAYYFQFLYVNMLMIFIISDCRNVLSSAILNMAFYTFSVKMSF